MNRREWLEQRRTGIGGSDIAAVCGMSKWKTPFDVYREKVMPIEDEPPTLAMELGNYLEPLIIKKYESETGAKVRSVDAIAMDDHKFARCNLDGFVTLPDGTQGILECKTAGDSRQWGEPGTEQIPQEYYLQCQWNMLVSGTEWCDVPVLFFDRGRRIEIYHVDRSEKVQAVLLERAKEFWNRVEYGIPPEPESGEETEQLHPQHTPGDYLEASREIVGTIEKLKALKSEQKKAADAIKFFESELKIMIAEKEGVKDGDRVLATWKASTAKRLDTKRLKDELPEVAGKYTTETTSRRFLVK